MNSPAMPEKGDKRRVRQAPKRARYDRDSLNQVLDVCTIGHVSFSDKGWPQSVPTAIARIGDFLYLHGHPKSRLYKILADGERVCVSVCRVDALVKARSAFHCSMNYRSAVVFGCGELVNDEEKRDLLDLFTDKLIPGSLNDYRPHLAKELKGTVLVRIALDDFSVKIRTGDPVDDDEDLHSPHWAGIIPIESRYGAPLAADNLIDDVHPSSMLLAGANP